MYAALQHLLRRASGLGGGALFLVSTTVVNAGNYLGNLVFGRWLGPAAFADLSLIITLVLVITFVVTALQLTAARFTATCVADGDSARLGGLRDWLLRRAWGGGGAMLLLLVFGAPFWAQIFHTASAWPFVILGLAMPIYFAQGVERGILQGQTRFGRLSLSFQVEMAVRLGVGLLFVALGWSVGGATAGLALAFVATWLVARGAARGLPGGGTLPVADRRAVRAFVGLTGAALVGQILINNSDILIVKHFFDREAAGQYAALAMIGRIVFFATWSFVTVLFPIAARKQAEGAPHRHLLWLGLGLVAAVSAGIVAGALLVPDLAVRLLFGAAYNGVAPLLWLYALATALYALANVVITYRLSIGDGFGSALAVCAGVAQVAGLWFFHADLRQVVLVQAWLMLALLGALLGWDRWLLVRANRASTRPSHTGAGAGALT